MKRTNKTTGIRSGMIDNIEVKFSIIGINNGQKTFAVEGYFEDLSTYERYFGTTPILIDTATGNSFGIFVSNERFVFDKSYNIDALL